MHTKEWQCYFGCSDSFSSLELFREHLKHAHEDIWNNTWTEDLIRCCKRENLHFESLVCNICKSQMASPEVLLDHLVTHVKALSILAATSPPRRDDKEEEEEGGEEEGEEEGFKGSAGLSEVTSTTTSHKRTWPTQKAYLCPLCNMGTGLRKRKYTKQVHALKYAETTTHSGSTLSTERYQGIFQTTGAFDRHITQSHARTFLRANSTEYICSFCLCDTIADSIAVCSARFAHLQHFLEHLRSSHAQTPEHLKTFVHTCAPISTESYTSLPPHEMATRR